jgi:hypothetical protein
MFAKLIESGWVDMAYEDDEARILKIRTSKASRRRMQSMSLPKRTKRNRSWMPKKIPGT